MSEQARVPKMMTVRQVAKTGKIPCIALEHKVLINFDAFVEQLHQLKGVF